MISNEEEIIKKGKFYYNYVNALKKKLLILKSKYELKIKMDNEIISNYFNTIAIYFEKKCVTESEKIDFDLHITYCINITFKKMKSYRKIYRRQCLKIQKKIINLEDSYFSTILTIKKNIIKEINNNIIIDSIRCSICFDIGPPVILTLPCRYRTHDQTNSKRPHCWGHLCLSCANKICIYRFVNKIICPFCNSLFNKKANIVTTKSFSINTHLMTSIDKYLEYENKKFKDKFFVDLNPIICNTCNAVFNTLSELESHIIHNQETHSFIQNKNKDK